MTTRLDQSFQQIRQFTLHASHELKTPLTAMRLHLETTLHDAISLAPEQRRWMLDQLEEMQRLTRIVDGLTLLTKADAGLVPLEKRPVRLSQLVRESFEDTVVLAEAHEVQATLTGCEELVVLGDPDRLRQALLNLTDNAVKYNRAGGTVRMALRKAEEAAEIEITNTGDGIPSELQPHVFERFVRGSDALSKAGDGCGLGLTIVQWIVQAHGGAIQISSDATGKTTAAVRLPLA
jgi:signal transduction histidine kinase